MIFLKNNKKRFLSSGISHTAKLLPDFISNFTSRQNEINYTNDALAYIFTYNVCMCMYHFTPRVKYSFNSLTNLVSFQPSAVFIGNERVVTGLVFFLFLLSVSARFVLQNISIIIFLSEYQNNFNKITNIQVPKKQQKSKVFPPPFCHKQQSDGTCCCCSKSLIQHLEQFWFRIFVFLVEIETLLCFSFLTFYNPVSDGQQYLLGNYQFVAIL